MTTRTNLSRIWASSAAAETTYPGDEKYTLGWIGEIPTYQALNWLQNKSDTNAKALAERGIPEWGNDITYQKNAVVWNNADGYIYVAQVANPSTALVPSANLGQWSRSIIQLTETEYQAAQAALEAHKNRVDNPHKVTAAQIGAYTRAQTNSLVSTANANLTAHKNDTTNPHKVTAAQAGAVPITGGTYTGQVTFNATETLINPSNGSAAITSADGIMLRSDGDLLGINNSGEAVFNGSELVTEANYEEVRRGYEPSFAVPVPDCHCHPLTDINLYHGFGTTSFTRSSTQEYVDKSGNTVTAAIDEPRFTKDGLSLSKTLGENFYIDADLNKSGFQNSTTFTEFIFPTGSGGAWVWSNSDVELETLFISGGRMYQRLNTADGGVNIPILDGVPRDTILKVVCTVSSDGVARTYLNGEFQSQETGILLGEQYSQIRFCYSGVAILRDFKTWSSVLTDDQIRTL